MKESLRKLLFVAILYITTINVYANYSGGNFDTYLNNSISTQVEGMIRYGDVETSLFTGTLNFSVPIYSLKDPDFNLDIVLHYNSDAFKPLKHSGWVGYNWYLQAGGCITREVRNYADEAVRKISDNSSDLGYSKGMYIFAKETNYSKDDIFNQNSNCFCNCTSENTKNIGNDCRYDVDYMPDIFHFNFMGYSGTFMINNAGEVQIVSGDYVKVDLSQAKDILDYPNKSKRPKPCSTSQITIKTKDGYTYIFGGKISALEFTYALESKTTEKDQLPPTISSWHLSKVAAPNGRTMDYYYKKGSYEEDEWPLNDSRLFRFNQYYDIFAPNYMDVSPFTITSLNNLEDYFEKEQMYNSTNNLKFCYIKECVLDSICVSGETPIKVYFYNSASRRPLYANTEFNAGKNNYMLDSIHVVSNSRIIRSTTMNYQTLSQDKYYWHFLSEVYNVGQGKYTLKYNTNLYKLPNLSMQKDCEYYNLVDLNGYWKTYPFKGLLKEVHFPTGGYQTYSYNKHYYSTEQRFRTQQGFVEMYSKTTGSLPLAGARIEEINTFDSVNRLIEKKTYSYSTPGTSSVSSGVYYNNWVAYSADESECYFVQTSNSYSFLDPYIGYSNVEECVKDGNNKTMYINAYVFDTGLDHFTSNSTNVLNDYVVAGMDRNAVSGMLTYNENMCTKGKLLSYKCYDKEKKLVKSIQRTYNSISNSNINHLRLDTIVIFSHYWENPISRKFYIYPDVLLQEETFDYNQENDVPLTTTRTYSYDQKLRKKKETITDSRDIKHFTKYTYPDEIPTNYYNNPYHLLSLSNRIGKPIETVSGYIENNTEYITGGAIDIYTNFFYRVVRGGHGNRPIPYLYKTLSLTSSNPVTNYQSIETDHDSVIYDPHYHLTCEYKFDKKFRLISIKPFGQMETKYTWDGIYPVTKTTGNQTWRYEYIPYVGVKSTTDPRGITTYYTYDAAGRLIEEYQLIDGNKQILNAYQYHIKTEEK